MKKSNLMPSIVLGCICLVAALLLSVVNSFTAPLIAKKQSEAASGAFVEVLPGAAGQEKLTLDSSYPTIVKEGYKFDNGFVFQMEVTGKDSGFVIMVGIDLDGKVTGTKVIANKETPSYFANVFADSSSVDHTYTGVDLGSFEPQLVAGATLTSKAYSEAVKAALQAFAIANGSAIDTRTEEEKHEDALNFALGTTDKTFERWLATEHIDGLYNAYVCDAGVVFVFGGEYIGVNNSGNVVKSASKNSTQASDASAASAAKAQAAFAIYSSTLAADYKIEVARPSGASKRVTKIELTKTGNYIMYMEAAGNGKNGDEYTHPSGEYIEFTVCISAEGKIIDVKTTYQSESENYGDYCETDEYTEQFRGAVFGDIVLTDYDTSKDSTDLGVIAGSTYTSRGYQQALQRAFTAFEKLTEGGNG